MRPAARFTCLLAAALLAPAHANDADTVPQDPVKQEAARKARIDYVRSLTVGAYDKAGTTSPKWDAAAREAMEAYARHVAQPHSMLADEEYRAVAKATAAALAAGCDDPLVRYLAEWHRDRFGDEGCHGERFTQYLERAAALAKSKYPDALKLWVCVEAIENAQLAQAPGGRFLIGSVVGPLKRLQDALFQDGERPARQFAYRTFETMRRRLRTLQGPVADIIDDMPARIEKLPKDKPLYHLITATRQVESAWDARGGGVAAEVGGRRIDTFKAMLKKAVKPIEAACKLDPDDPAPCVAMIEAARGLSLPREEVEEWFRRAMKADGNSSDACFQKLEYLTPKWHGSDEEARAFALACVRTGNWAGGLPMMLIRYHEERLRSTRAGVEYFGDPQVRADFRLVYDGLLAKHPDAHFARTRYASLLYKCGLKDEARAQFERLGANVTKAYFRKADDLELIQERVGIKPPPARAAAVPQDAAKQAAVRQGRLDYALSLTAGAYDKAGAKSPKWDGPARDALAAFARVLAGQETSLALDHHPAIAKGTAAAIAAGCDDPLVRYLAEWHQDRFSGEGRTQARFVSYVERAEAFLKSPVYPDALKLRVAADAVQTAGQSEHEDVRPAVNRLGGEVHRLAPLVIKAEDRPAREFAYRAIDTAKSALAAVPNEHEPLAAALMIELHKEPRDKPLVRLLEGFFRFDVDWQLEAAGVPGNVPEARKQAYQQLVLRKAQPDLEAAWKLDPDDPWAAVAMQTVVRLTNGPRARAEEWFQRAMKADGDSVSACMHHMEYLLARGRPGEAREFALACARTENWDGGLPWVLRACRERMRGETPEGEYYRTNEVSDDMRRAYAGLFARHPNARAPRTEYALLLLKCGLHADADEQFTALGDGVMKWYFRDAASLDAQRKAAKKR